MAKAIRFDNELAIVRGLAELRRHGTALHDLERELTRIGPVDLDVLYSVMDRIFARIEAEAAPPMPVNVSYAGGYLSAAG